MPIGNHCIDRGQQARELHRQKQLREEALLGPLEDRQRCGLGTRVKRPAGFAVYDPRGLQRFAEVGMDDRSGLGIGIVDHDLIPGQAMLEDFILDTGERKGPGRVKAE